MKAKGEESVADGLTKHVGRQKIEQYVDSCGMVRRSGRREFSPFGDSAGVRSCVLSKRASETPTVYVWRSCEHFGDSSSGRCREDELIEEMVEL